MFFRGFLHSGQPGDERLDRPLSNYDVIGIPTGSWSTHFCAIFSNIIPSCVLSFFCPCIIWAQIVVRAQLPLLIGLKNSIPALRAQTGYGLFIAYWFWSMVIMMAILALIISNILPSAVVYFLCIVYIGLLLAFLYLNGHTRTAFREKYNLPGCLPDGCEVWSMFVDSIITVACFPCALSQVHSRHTCICRRASLSIVHYIIYLIYF